MTETARLWNASENSRWAAPCPAVEFFDYGAIAEGLE